MNPLALIAALSPRAFWAAGLALLAAAVWAGHVIDVHRHEKKAYADGMAEVQGRWTAAELVRAQVAAKAEAAARAEEQRRTIAMKENADETQRLAARDRAAAAGAAAAAVGLRNAVAAVISGGGVRPSDSAAATFGPAASASSVLLTDVLGPAEERLRALAASLDQSRTAGEACVSAYDALTPTLEP
jgi:hypothetical protein